MKTQFNNLKNYHAEQDEKIQEMCDRRGITLDRLAELKAQKYKWSVEWASWILQKESMTKLNYLTATKILQCS